ncbi:MAG: Glucose-methanol-choline (GMC) oxidoreductase:NAD binding site, partial [uncultured Gemmatimonadetes bacterium]
DRQRLRRRHGGVGAGGGRAARGHGGARRLGGARAAQLGRRGRLRAHPRLRAGQRLPRAPGPPLGRAEPVHLRGRALGVLRRLVVPLPRGRLRRGARDRAGVGRRVALRIRRAGAVLHAGRAAPGRLRGGRRGPHGAPAQRALPVPPRPARRALAAHRPGGAVAGAAPFPHPPRHRHGGRMPALHHLRRLRLRRGRQERHRHAHGPGAGAARDGALPRHHRGSPGGGPRPRGSRRVPHTHGRAPRIPRGKLRAGGGRPRHPPPAAGLGAGADQPGRAGGGALPDAPLQRHDVRDLPQEPQPGQRAPQAARHPRLLLRCGRRGRPARQAGEPAAGDGAARRHAGSGSSEAARPHGRAAGGAHDGAPFHRRRPAAARERRAHRPHRPRPLGAAAHERHQPLLAPRPGGAGRAGAARQEDPAPRRRLGHRHLESDHLFARRGHRAHGPRRGDGPARPRMPLPRPGEPVRDGWKLLPDLRRGEPQPHHRGQRAAGGAAPGRRPAPRPRGGGGV